MVRLDSVSQTHDGQLNVLSLVQLQIERGEFVYVVGGTGAGKSSLLRLMATEVLPSSGTVSLFGYNLAQATPQTLRAIRRAIGYIPQDIRLIPDLTVFENVALSFSLSGSRVLAQKCRAKVGEILESLGLAAKKSKLARTLSGGEAQRVAIARALVRSPELVIADEPTGAQDRDFTWSVMDLLVKYNLSNTTVVIATHDRELVRRVRKRCVVLKTGQIAMDEVGACIY